MTTQYIDFVTKDRYLTIWDEQPRHVHSIPINSEALWFYAYKQELLRLCSFNGFVNPILIDSQIAQLAETNIPIDIAYKVASDVAAGIPFNTAYVNNTSPVNGINAVTIGVLRSDGDLEVLATLTNNDGTGTPLPLVTFERLVAATLGLLRSNHTMPDIASSEIKAYARQDMPDVLSTSDDWQEIDL